MSSDVIINIGPDAGTMTTVNDTLDPSPLMGRTHDPDFVVAWCLLGS